MDRLLRGYPRLRWVLTLILVASVVVFGRLGDDQRGEHVPPGEAHELSGFVRVIDGDSLRIGGSEVRLLGIDAPEGRQTCEREGKAWDCGEESRRQLQRLIGGQKVSCRSLERDKHGRYLGTCEAGGQTLNAAMVESGFAVSYGSYRNEEGAAKSARRGLWAGTFQMPREWRRDHGIGG
ncbi:MAG: thermonuclease family protein [Hyphomicrobiaceae bacterium]